MVETAMVGTVVIDGASVGPEQLLQLVHAHVPI